MEKAVYSRKQIHENIAFYLISIISFSLAFKSIVPILIILLMINWLVEGYFKEKFSNKKNSLFLILSISFILAHVIALAYTKNITEGLTNIEVKLSFLIFPLFFFTTQFRKEQLKKIITAFIYGCAIAAIGCLSRACYCYFNEGQNYFFYEDLSYFMHPSYFSMYVNLAIFFLLQRFFTTRRNDSTTKLITISLILFFIVVIFMLSSKLGIISFLVLSGCYSINQLLKRKKHLLLVVILFSAISGLFAAYNFSSAIKGRFDNLFTAVNTETIDKSNAESSAVRILIWGESKKLIKDNLWIGVSPGDTDDQLVAAYEKNGIQGAFKNRLNAHNEFYQTTIGLGIVGLLLLLALFILPLFHAIKQQKTVYILFILLVAMNFLVESMLQTQAGVIFYAFFNSLLLYSQKTS